MMMIRIFLLAVLCVAPVFSQTTILGHHVGESVTQFLSAEPGLQSRIESCRASEPKPMTPEQIHVLSKQDIESLGAEVFQRVLTSTDTGFRVKLKRNPSREELESLARQGMPISIDKRLPDVVDTCRALGLLTQPTPPPSIVVHSLPNTRPHPITWHFSNGALDRMDIDFHGGDFDQIAGDFTHKTGIGPKDSRETDTPNRYGGIIHVSRKVTWLTRELYVLLETEEGGLNAQIDASVMSRASYETWAKTHAIKSTLD